MDGSWREAGHGRTAGVRGPLHTEIGRAEGAGRDTRQKGRRRQTSAQAAEPSTTEAVAQEQDDAQTEARQPAQAEDVAREEGDPQAEEVGAERHGVAAGSFGKAVTLKLVSLTWAAFARPRSPRTSLLAVVACVGWRCSRGERFFSMRSL